MPNKKRDIQRWQQRKGAADLRIAIMLASKTDDFIATRRAYDDRLEKLFSRADYDRLFDAWESGQDAPADLYAQMQADADLSRLWSKFVQLLWLLDCVQRAGVVSEHYVYHQTGGKMRGPNGEQ